MPHDPHTEGDAHHSVKSKFMNFDSTVTSGNILTAAAAVLSVGVGWGVLTARLDASDQRALAQRAEFAQMIADQRESMREQRAEMREVQKTLNGLSNDTALIRGRLASNEPTRAKP